MLKLVSPPCNDTEITVGSQTAIWENELFFKLSVFSIIRSFLFSVSIQYIFKMLVWSAVLRGSKKEVFVQFEPDV